MCAAVALTGSRTDGEDLLQAALERLLQNWSRVDTDAEGYLRRTLYNLAADGWRRRGRWRGRLAEFRSQARAAGPGGQDIAVVAHLDGGTTEHGEEIAADERAGRLFASTFALARETLAEAPVRVGELNSYSRFAAFAIPYRNGMQLAVLFLDLDRFKTIVFETVFSKPNARSK